MKKEKKKREIDYTSIRFNVIAVLLIAIFCFSISPKTLQNDTFYTIKIGEHILENGIDMKDPFSFHELKYTYPHWLYDVGIYLIYNIGGHAGIYTSTIILCMALGILIYFTNVKLTKNKLTSFIITIGSMYLLRGYIAARAQLATFILFILTIYFIEQFLETKKKRYAIGLIIIPILMANLHLAVFPFYFILYLPYVVEYMVYILSNAGIIVTTSKINSMHKKLKNIQDEKEIEKIKNKILELELKNEKLQKRYEKSNTNPYKIKIVGNHNVKLLAIVMIICVFTGLLTPLGDTPYTYLVKTMQGNTTQNINEHLPLTLIQNLDFMCVLMVFLGILIFTDTKIRLNDLFMIGGLTLLTFYTRRQVSMFVLIGSVILNRLICSMFDKYNPDGCKNTIKAICRPLGMVSTIAIVLALCINMYKPKIGNKFINEKAYPVDAATYILDNLDIENIRIYNEYNYGSYLLYRGIPVFVDSRADLYAPEFNEGTNVFNDYLSLSNVSNDKVEETLDKYDITHMIMYKDAKLRTFIKQDENKYNLLYEDDSFCIYERKQVEENNK